MKKQPRRDWKEARAKVEREGGCRLYGRTVNCGGPLEAAHVIGREHDREFTIVQRSMLLGDPPYRKEPWPVAPERVVPLCAKHHKVFDSRMVDLLPALTDEEQVQAVADAGGIALAMKRTAPVAYKRMNGAV